MSDKITKLIATFKSLPIKTQRLLGLGMTMALVLALPIFIWSIVTQRFNFLNRAASGEISGEPPTPTTMATATPTPLAKPTPTPSKQCLKNEACPVHGQPNLLRSCHPGDTDGTTQDSLCDRAGRIETCGYAATKYCCPKAGGSWTTKMTACNVKPTPKVIPTPSPRIPTSSPVAKPTLRPTLSPTPKSTPIAVPTQTPTSGGNPVISTTYLPAGAINRYYSGTVNGYEMGSNINLYVTFSNLPSSLLNGGCTNSTNQKQTTVACKIVGYPKARGLYYINARIFDQMGHSTSKTLTLLILPWWF